MKSAFVLLALLIGAQTFHILRKQQSKNHQDITRSAILKASAKACKLNMQGSLDNAMLIAACRHGTPENFEEAIRIISYYNVMTDLKHISSAKHHFDNEEFKEGRKLITTGIQNIEKFIVNEKFDDARQTLGEILHTLQDFYSHSNWIELGNTEPYTALINQQEPLNNLAGEFQETCEKSCSNENCGAKILPDIILHKVLTSGYFGQNKPIGKCSHGGKLDFTTGFQRRWDGINKDYSSSSHGGEHIKAADVAIKASVQLLEKILEKNSQNNFLRLVGLHSEKPKAEWKTHISFISFKERYPETTEDEFVEVY